MRPEDWPLQLETYIDKARSVPFAWGLNDCVSFACGWHQLMTGRDVYALFRESYGTENEAMRIMIKHGVHGMEEAGRFLFGEPRPGNTHIQRGDIAYAQSALGICTGATGAFLNEEGLTFIRLADFELGWSV
jgi:hypothetical protein